MVLNTPSRQAEAYRTVRVWRWDLSDINRRGFMKSVAGATVGIGLPAQRSRQQPQRLPAYCNPALPVKQRVADLLGRMTLEEKVAQTLCPWQIDRDLRDDHGNFSEANARKLLKNGIGMILSIPGLIPDLTYKGQKPTEAANFANAAQKFLKEETRLGIPAIFVGEGLHGYVAPDATSFPQAIALASTWDLELVHDVYTVAAAQARARGHHHFDTPLLDVARDPRWGRTEETYGEDPYLVARMGVAAIRAFQGPGGPMIDKQHVIACVKHFAGYGQPDGGRNIAPANISERTFREFILASFRAGIVEGGAHAVMPSYNEIDGIPSHANAWLLQSVLRKEWGFEGYVLADAFGVDRLITDHHIVGDPAAAAKAAIEAGVDTDLSMGRCFSTLSQQVRDGVVSNATLDRAVGRILRGKFLLGLFDNPYVDPDYADAICRFPKHRELALKSAQRAIVLLKNEGGLLPLDQKKLNSIAVIGPNADTVRLGGYTGTPAYTVSILNGIKNKLGSRVKVGYELGCAITEGNAAWSTFKVEPADPSLDAQRIADAVNLAKTADLAIVAVGDNEQTAREAGTPEWLGDRDSLDLVGRQDDLVKAIVNTGKPTIVVLIAGRPTSIRYIAANVPAIVGCWSLGQETGNAIADVLFGDYNPGGKLPMTFPQSVGQLPAYYNHKPSAERRYLLSVNEPLFPFGWGLSYARFNYDNLSLQPSKIGLKEHTKVRVNLTNVGRVAGEEVVQLYIRDQVSSVTRPVKELKGFQRLQLQPGETKQVEFRVGPEELAFWNKAMEWVVEPGMFDIMVGGNSVELTKTVLEVVQDSTVARQRTGQRNKR
jgi:beta-xylosidase